MLDQNDLKILAGMFTASEERMMKRMDELDTRLSGKMDELDTRLSGRMDELDTRLSGRMDELDTRLSGRMDELDTRLSERIDGLDTKIGELAVRVDSLEVQMKKSENLFVDELSRTQIYLERKIDTVQKSLDRVEQYYRADRLENENISTLLKLYTGLRNDVDKLNEKIA